MPERRRRVIGRGRGLFAIDVDDGGAFRAATAAEVDAALRQRELFGAAEYAVQNVDAAERTGDRGVGLLRRILAILDQAPSERDARDVVIEQQDREISRLRDELARHKDVHRDNGRVHRQNDGLQRQNQRLRRENEHLKQQLGAERRAGRRQAAPFAKDRPQGRGGRPGRRPGARYGRQGRRPCPARVDETLAAPAPATCPDCGGAVTVTGAASQYEEDLPPVRPLVRRFDIEVGHCSQCRRRIQGRHALQTSDALGAASAQLGLGVVALVVELHTHGGMPLAKVADLLQTRFGLHVTPGGLANLLHRAARDARPAYEALCEQIRHSPVVTADETGWRVGALSHWLWAAVTPTTTVYAICAGRGFDDAQAVLGADFDGVLVRDGWVVYPPLHPRGAPILSAAPAATL